MSQEEEKNDRFETPGIRPPWIVRRGIGILFTLLCLLVLGSIFVKVPRTVPAFVSGVITDTVFLPVPEGKEAQPFFTPGSTVIQGQPVALLTAGATAPEMSLHVRSSLQELEKTVHFFYHDAQLLRAPATGRIYAYGSGSATLAFIVPANTGVSLFSEIEAGSLTLRSGDPVSLTLGEEETITVKATVDSVYPGTAPGRLRLNYRLGETERSRVFTHLRGKGLTRTSGTADIVIGTESFFTKVSRKLFQRNYSTP